MAQMTPSRRPSNSRRVCFIVMEDGAHLSGSRLSHPECDDTIVLRQMSDELPGELMKRTLERIVRIEESGANIGMATILTAPRCDRQSMAARHLLASALLAHARVATELPLEVVLCTDGSADFELRRELIALADLLSLPEPNFSARLRIHFGPSNVPLRPPARTTNSLKARYRNDEEIPEPAVLGNEAAGEIITHRSAMSE